MVLTCSGVRSSRHPQGGYLTVEHAGPHFFFGYILPGVLLDDPGEPLLAEK
jgi:hypothetical protein